jgi:Protein of unknown function (DUF3313)
MVAAPLQKQSDRGNDPLAQIPVRSGGLAAEDQGAGVAVDHRIQELLRQEAGIRRSYLPLAHGVRLTLTGATANTPVLSTLSRFDVAGAVYNGVQAARDGEGSLTGSVIYAVEFFDATTSRLLSAFVSRQYPNPYNTKASVGALAAAEAGIDKSAESLMAQLR